MADPPTHDFATLQKSLQAALISTTRTTSSLCAEDLPFQRSLDPTFARELDRQNARLLALAERLLGSAVAVAPDGDAVSAGSGSGSDPKTPGAAAANRVVAPRLRNAEELDRNWTKVVDVVDSLLERTDGVLDEVRGVMRKGLGAVTSAVAEVGCHVWVMSMEEGDICGVYANEVSVGIG